VKTLAHSHPLVIKFSERKVFSAGVSMELKIEKGMKHTCVFLEKKDKRSKETHLAHCLAPSRTIGD